MDPEALSQADQAILVWTSARCRMAPRLSPKQLITAITIAPVLQVEN
jgi:hypothetical protein